MKLIKEINVDDRYSGLKQLQEGMKSLSSKLPKREMFPNDDELAKFNITAEYNVQAFTNTGHQGVVKSAVLGENMDITLHPIHHPYRQIHFYKGTQVVLWDHETLYSYPNDCLRFYYFENKFRSIFTAQVSQDTRIKGMTFPRGTEVYFAYGELLGAKLSEETKIDGRHYRENSKIRFGKNGKVTVHKWSKQCRNSCPRVPRYSGQFHYDPAFDFTILSM